MNTRLGSWKPAAAAFGPTQTTLRSARAISALGNSGVSDGSKQYENPAPRSAGHQAAPVPCSPVNTVPRHWRIRRPPHAG